MPDIATERIELLLEGNTAEYAGAAALAVERLDSGLSNAERSIASASKAATAFDRILGEIESASVGGTADGLKQIDAIMRDLSKKSPADFLEGIDALKGSLGKTLLDMSLLTPYTNQATKAWEKLVQQIRQAEQAQVRKHDRNVALESARADSRQFADQMASSNRVPTELQSASNPKSIDYAMALESQSRKVGAAIEASAHSALEEAAAIAEATTQAQRLSSVYDLVEKRAKSAARSEARAFADQMASSNRVPTELQSASNPKSIDYAAALATQSQKAGSAIEAAAHSAMEEATAIGEAAQNASKLSSVYDVIAKRAKAAAKADQDWLAERMRASNRIPTALQDASNPKALTGGQKAFQSFSRAFGPRATQGLVSTVETMEKIGPIASKIGPPLANAAMAVGAIGIAAVGAGAYAAKEFAGAVIHAQGFREDMSLALKTISGTEEKANSIIERATSTADYLGKKHSDTVGRFTALMGKGFDLDTTDNLVRKLDDMRVRAPTAQLDSMVLALGQINSKGKLAAEELGQLTEAGLNKKDFMGVLATQTGKSVDEMEKRLQAGKISSEEFMKAFLETGSKDGGPLGALAHEQSRKNINAIIDRVKAIPENILFGAKAGPGMDAAKEQLNTFIDWFDVNKGKGKEVQKVTGDLFNSLIEGLTGKKVDTSKGITGTLDAILVGAKEAVPVVREMAEGARGIMSLVGALMSVAGAASSAAEPFGGLGNIWTTMTFPLRALGATILGPITMLPELYSAFKNFDGIGGTFETTVASVKNAASSIAQEALNLGTAVIDGIVQGITSGASRAWAAISGVATGIVSAAKGALDSHSPSRIMVDLGADTTGGLPIGMEKKAPAAFAAAHDVGSGVAASVLAGMKPANDIGSIAALAMEPVKPANSNGMNATQAASATGGGSPTGGTVINVTFAPVIKADGGRSDADNRAAAAAAVAGSQEEFDRMLAVSVRRMRAAGGF